ncbi:MAG TPA: hemerythrin family protein [Anaeromyxobacter sp.]|nr:hemerythrin family protein [Anaeromyxobacter sp.]
MPGEWSPELTLNNELLDGQHVDLFRRLSAAAAALDAPRDALDRAVDEFADALVSHLAVEERLMDETLYPERVRHKSAHELFVAEFEKVRAELRALGPTPTVVEGLRRRVPEWLKFHTRVNDAPFGAYLARRRAAGAPAGRTRDDGRRLS